MKLAIFTIVFLASCMVLFSKPALAQRDYFTDEEVEMVRDAQAIDSRIDVLTHVIDRRFKVLKVDTAEPGAAVKDDKWGPLPSGTRLELLTDINYVLQKAIDDIDNLVENPNSAPLPFEGEKK